MKYRNRIPKRLFPVLPMIKKIINPNRQTLDFFWHVTVNTHIIFFWPNIYKKTAWCTTLCGENAVHFLCTPKWRVRGYIAPPKMKVKGYMYPQMKKPLGILVPGISFSKFPVSRHLLKLFYDELCSFSTFFALNFDKKLAVE